MGASDERLEKAYRHWGFRGCVVPGCISSPRLHHIVARREGGTNALSNLLPICAGHEGGLHKAGYYARRVEAGLSPDDAYLYTLSKRERRRFRRHGTIEQQPKPEHLSSDFLYGCHDCQFQFTERPPYCGACKDPGSKMSCLKASSPTLKGYRESEAHIIQVEPFVRKESEQDKFDRLRRARSKRHSKKYSNYVYGKRLATNMAAPFIARLRREAARLA